MTDGAPPPPPRPALVVTLTGIAHRERPALAAQVRALGGTVARALTPATTHVVCGRAGTAKHARARAAGTPCVTRAWLDAAAAAAHALPETAPFAVPPLLGCVLCPSGLDARGRTALARAAAALGALVGLALTTAATHVVATPAAVAARSTKVVRARELRIPVVRPAWLARALASHTRPDEGAPFAFPQGEGQGGREGGGSNGGYDDDDDGGVQELVQLVEEKEEAQEKEKEGGPLGGCWVALVGMAPAQRVALKGLLRALGAAGTAPLDAPHLTHVVLAHGCACPPRPAGAPVHVVGVRWLAACAQTHCRLREACFAPDAASGGVLLGSVVALAGLSDGNDDGVATAAAHCRALVRAAGAACAEDVPGTPVNYVVSTKTTATTATATATDSTAAKTATSVSPAWLELCVATQSVLDPAMCAVLRGGSSSSSTAAVLAGTGLALTGFGTRGRAVWGALAAQLGAHVHATLCRGACAVVVACPGTAPHAPKVRAACRWHIPLVAPAWLDACARAHARVPLAPFLLPGSPQPPECEAPEPATTPAAVPEPVAEPTQAPAAPAPPVTPVVGLLRRPVVRLDLAVDALDGAEDSDDSACREPAPKRPAVDLAALLRHGCTVHYQRHA